MTEPTTNSPSLGSDFSMIVRVLGALSIFVFLCSLYQSLILTLLYVFSDHPPDIETLTTDDFIILAVMLALTIRRTP